MDQSSFAQLNAAEWAAIGTCAAVVALVLSTWSGISARRSARAAERAAEINRDAVEIQSAGWTAKFDLQCWTGGGNYSLGPLRVTNEGTHRVLIESLTLTFVSEQTKQVLPKILIHNQVCPPPGSEDRPAPLRHGESVRFEWPDSFVPKPNQELTGIGEVGFRWSSGGELYSEACLLSCDARTPVPKRRRLSE